MNHLYEQLKARGLDVSWYEKVKRVNPGNRDETPLSDDRCSRLSIYLLKKDACLWTTTSDGHPYMLARRTKSKVKEDIFLCACCKQTFTTYSNAIAHSSIK